MWLWVDKRPVGHGAVACVGCGAEAQQHQVWAGEGAKSHAQGCFQFSELKPVKGLGRTSEKVDMSRYSI